VASPRFTPSPRLPVHGLTSQFFQRLIMQQWAQGVSRSICSTTDCALPTSTAAPSPRRGAQARHAKGDDPKYGQSIQEFVRANTVDTFDGQPVNFQKTFFGTITPEMASDSDPSILGLLDLEIWGAPTSKPAYDPTNKNFIYQRFQRGIMHYDKSCGCTQGLLLADYLKALVTGENLPADLAARPRKVRRRSVNGTAPTQPCSATFVKGMSITTETAPTTAAVPTRRRRLAAADRRRARWHHRLPAPPLSRAPTTG
jgi:hypothetical protein